MQRARDSPRQRKAELGQIACAWKNDALVAGAHGVPKSMIVKSLGMPIQEERPVLYRLALEQPIGVQRSRGKNGMAERIGSREFQPGLNHIERPGGKGVADFGIDDESLDCGHFPGGQGIFRKQVHGDDWTPWPDLVDFWDDCPACEPLLDQLDLLVRSGKVQHLWDKGADHGES